MPATRLLSALQMARSRARAPERLDQRRAVQLDPQQTESGGHRRLLEEQLRPIDREPAPFKLLRIRTQHEGGHGRCAGRCPSTTLQLHYN